MEIQEYANMRNHEDTHWWYVSLRRLVVSTLKERFKQNQSLKILDAGCGTGGMLAVLKKEFPSGELFGIDYSEEAIRLTNARSGIDVRQGSVSALDFEDGSFDAVVSLDVLYHLGVDEPVAIKELFRVVKPGGYIVLNLPAFESLRGTHDIIVHTRERYTKKSVYQKLSFSEDIDSINLLYWNVLLFFPLFVWRKISNKFVKNTPNHSHSDINMTPKFINSCLNCLMYLDHFLAKRLAFPFGSSLFVIIKTKPV